MNWIKIFTTEVPLILQGLNVIFLLGGKNLNPITHQYNKIFEPNLYSWVYIFICLFLCLVGIYLKDVNLAIFYSTPLLFIIFLLIFNKIIKIIYKRNIIIVTRWNFKPKKATFLDVIFGYLIVLLSIILPLIYLIIK